MSRPRGGARVAWVGIAGAGVVAALGAAGAAGLGVRDTLVLLALAGGAATAAAVGTVALLTRMSRRDLRVQLVVVALVAVAATAAGVAVAAWAMFLSGHDLGVLGVVLLLSASVGVSAAWILGWQVGDGLDGLGQRIDALAGDDVPDPPRRLPTAELQRLSEVLTVTHRQLVDARQRAARLEASRRELVAWVSHDLRSPIGSVRAMAEALEDGLVAEPADVASYHRAIVQEVQRLAALVDDLFELSRIEAGAPPLDVPFVPLHELVADVIEAARVRADAQGVALHAEVHDLGPELVVAADVRRAIDNVVDNAIRHTPAGGSVTATARADGTGLVVVVWDECGGIPASDIDRIFDVAFRGDDSRSSDTGGGGLGLAIARGLVEARAGGISVRNREPGCEFTVRLPAEVPS
ncbi:MAG TPA: HAMP domain-containing sensor histidine kinase [Acidimicrobiales bacterium]|nr:HAMP domain-containing sensor histidine kinase [Acidimicrobiales bacterium]